MAEGAPASTSARAPLAVITQHDPPPEDARFLEFHQSDGDSSRWPQPHPGPSRDPDGKLNYYRPLGLDERGSTDWRKKIGIKVAELMKKPNANTYYLATWPPGYGLFVHVREQLSNGLLRHDLYLHGSKHALRFRSANEFIPHAHWLLTTTTMDKSECECKYCGKKKLQQDVNEKVLGEYSRSYNMSSPTKGRPKRRETQTPYEVTASARLTQRQEARYKQPKFRLPLAVNDLPSMPYTARARHAELHEDRMTRDGELIWIPLQRPIEHPDNPAVRIEFWPAFALDVHYEKEVHPNIDPDLISVTERVDIVTRPLAAGETSVRVVGSSVLPFRAWELDLELINLLRITLPPSDFDPHRTNAIFDPHGNRGELAGDISFKRAAPYYILAIQMAGHMDSFWSPMFQIDSGIPGLSAAFFQGLWLGAERIWLEDLVRLTLDHKELLTHHELRDKLLAPDYSSETRSLFMRINEIVVDNTPTMDGPRKVCRISGPLFCCVPEHMDTDQKADSTATKTGPIPASASAPPTCTSLSAHISAKTKITDSKTLQNLQNFPLPDPPIGFQYVLLTKPDCEIILDGMMIAGRYYPKLLLNSSLNITWIRNNSELWWWTLVAMSGLAAGRFARSSAQHLMRKRKEAAEISEKAARKELSAHWGQVQQSRSPWVQP